MKLLHCFKIQMRQVFSKRLVVISLGIVLLQAMSVWNYIVEGQTSVWYIVGYSSTTGVVFFTRYMLPALVFSHTIATEWNENATNYWIIRSGLRSYTVSKLLASACAGFLAVWIAYGLFIAITVCFYPLYDSGWITSAYETVMEDGHVISGMAFFVLDNALSGAIIAAIGMCASVFVISPYTAVTAPLVLNLTLSRIVFGLGLPDSLNPVYWLRTNDTAQDVATAVLSKLTVTVILILIMMILSMAGMRRRAEHG